jgi:hypothetical protein
MSLTISSNQNKFTCLSTSNELDTITLYNIISNSITFSKLIYQLNFIILTVYKCSMLPFFWNFHYSKKSNSFCEVANWLKLSITHSADLNFWNISFKVMLKYMIWRHLWPLVQPLHIWSAINTKFKELFCFFKPSIEQHFCKQSKACKHSCRVFQDWN